MIDYTIHIQEMDAELVAAAQQPEETREQYEARIAAGKGMAFFGLVIQSWDNRQIKRLSPLFPIGSDEARWQVFDAMLQLLATAVKDRENAQPRIIIEG